MVCSGSSSKVHWKHNLNFKQRELNLAWLPLTELDAVDGLQDYVTQYRECTCPLCVCVPVARSHGAQWERTRATTSRNTTTTKRRRRQPRVVVAMREKEEGSDRLPGARKDLGPTTPRRMIDVGAEEGLPPRASGVAEPPPRPNTPSRARPSRCPTTDQRADRRTCGIRSCDRSRG